MYAYLNNYTCVVGRSATARRGSVPTIACLTCLIMAEWASFVGSGFVSPLRLSVTVPSFESVSMSWVQGCQNDGQEMHSIQSSGGPAKHSRVDNSPINGLGTSDGFLASWSSHAFGHRVKFVFILGQNVGISHLPIVLINNSLIPLWIFHWTKLSYYNMFITCHNNIQCITMCLARERLSLG